MKKKRICKLCTKTIPKRKKMNKHHLSYEANITVNLCYVCHSIVHGRLIFKDPYEKRYGKDYAPYMKAIDIIKLYRPATQMITEKFFL